MINILFVLLMAATMTACGTNSADNNVAPIANKEPNLYPWRIVEVFPNPSSAMEYIAFKNVSSIEQTSANGWYFVVQSTKKNIKISVLRPIAANSILKTNYSSANNTVNWFANSDTLRLYDSLNTLVQTVGWVNAKSDSIIKF